MEGVARRPIFLMKKTLILLVLCLRKRKLPPISEFTGGKEIREEGWGLARKGGSGHGLPKTERVGPFLAGGLENVLASIYHSKRRVSVRRGGADIKKSG